MFRGRVGLGYLSNGRLAQEHELDAAAGLRLRSWIRHPVFVLDAGPKAVVPLGEW